MTSYLTQAASEIPCCTGVMVSAGSDSRYRHMVMALCTYDLISVSNLHRILGNLLGFLGHRTKSLALGTKSLLTSLFVPKTHRF